MKKVKFGEYREATAAYKDNYEMGLINDRILLEVNLAQDTFKTVSLRSSTKILDYIGDLGGFY